MTGWRRQLSVVPPAAWALVLLVAVIGLLQPRYLGASNLTNILRDAAILALVAAGQAIVIISGGIDLSAGSSVALVSVVTTLAALSIGVPGAFGLGLVVALLIGAVNGLLIARFDLPPFLATLGTLTAVHGLASVLVGGTAVAAPGGGFTLLGTASVGPLPLSIAIGAAGLMGLWITLRRTTLGRSWHLVGSSRPAAIASGVRVRWTIFAAYLAGSAFVGLAALVLTSRVNSGQPNLSPTLAFQAIAACAIGGIPLTGGLGGPLQVLIGVLFLAAVNNGLLVLDLPSAVQIALNGLLMIVAVATQRVRLGRLASASAEEPA